MAPNRYVAAVQKMVANVSGSKAGEGTETIESRVHLQEFALPLKTLDRNMSHNIKPLSIPTTFSLRQVKLSGLTQKPSCWMQT